MKISVVGLGYVGLSNAVVLAQHHEVVAVDLSAERVDQVNRGVSPLEDPELEDYLARGGLSLRATTSAADALPGSDYVIVATPTDYDPVANFFDTSSVESVISSVAALAPEATVVVKSTVPVGFTERLRGVHPGLDIVFSPEFLREGRALHDNLHPSRVVVGGSSDAARRFAELLVEGALDDDVPVLITEPTEAEAIKLFANTNLAALATVLVTAVARIASERGFGIAVFGEISLAFSLQNILLTVLTPISLLILPSIRRHNRAAFRTIYLTGLDRVAPILLLALVVFAPMSLFATQWLPDFTALPVYIAALMPLIIFETRTRLFAIPFLQALRRERLLTAVNVACLVLAVALSWFTVVAAESPQLLVLSLTTVVIVRALALEALTQKSLGISRRREATAELVVVILFLAASSGRVSGWMWLPATVAWAGYLWWQRGNLTSLFRRRLPTVRSPGPDQ